MDLNRLSMDLAAALEEARRVATRSGASYIKPKHLFAALLEPNGALARIAGAASLDAAMASRFIDQLPDPGNDGSVEPGKQPIASRALRDLLDRAFATADKRGTSDRFVLKFVKP